MGATRASSSPMSITMTTPMPRRNAVASKRTRCDGAAQIVEVRERVEEIAAPLASEAEATEETHPLFWAVPDDDMLAIGLPEDWLRDVKAADEDAFLELYPHLPGEAAEALLEYVSTCILKTPDPVSADDPFAHPDAQRRFRVLDDVEELQRALDAPWDRWTVFLHPAQRKYAEADFDGPARVTGSAGTGKTVVALHRAARLLKADADARLLLTTFSEPLSNALARKLGLLVSPAQLDRATIADFNSIGRQLFALAKGYEPRAASGAQIRSALQKAAQEAEFTEFDLRFLFAEWRNVIDAWNVASEDAYGNVTRIGRKTRLGAKQRARLWPVFARAREALASQGLTTWPAIFSEVASYYAAKDTKPFDHVVVDEAQDLSVAQLRMMAAIVPDRPNALFFAGDLGQRIFEEPFSWKSLGVDIRGRSHTLRVNYRTSHQIRTHLDRLLAPEIRDADGNASDRRGTVSVFNGPQPVVDILEDEQEEARRVARWIESQLSAGIELQEIGVFARTAELLSRARRALAQVSTLLDILELSTRSEERAGRVSIGTMHLAKGLEFKAVAVIGCDGDVLPLRSRVESAEDEAALDEVYETERQLFYVAATRARDALLITSSAPSSVFLEDLAN